MREQAVKSSIALAEEIQEIRDSTKEGGRISRIQAASLALLRCNAEDNFFPGERCEFRVENV